jgi:hypothetical protein
MKTWQEMSKEATKLSDVDARCVLQYMIGYCSEDVHFQAGLDWALKQVNKPVEAKS